MLNLYQFPISHFCEIARWALDFKKLQYRKTNLLPGAHIKIITRIAKNSSVPVLQDGDTYVQNSGDIISYLDDKYPKFPLTPVNSAEKSACLEWERYLHREIGVNLRRFYYHHLLQHPSRMIALWAQNGPFLASLRLRLMYPVLRKKLRAFMDINEQTAASSRLAVIRAIDRLEESHATSEFLVGGHFTRADLTAAAMLAPMIEPPAYGIDWPQERPKAVDEFVAQQRERLGWVADLYARYRFGLPVKKSKIGPQ